jgi:hypothetical protein
MEVNDIKKNIKKLKARIYDESILIKTNEWNELDKEDKDWDEELKEEEERGYNDYNWHEGDYDH